MRILFVPKVGADGIGDMLYSGLRKTTYVKLDEYPFKQQYHTTDMSAFDYVKPFWLIQSWGTENVIQDFDSVDLDSYDHILVNSPWLDPDTVFAPLIEKIGERMVFIDGNDDPYLRKAVRSSKVYFKRELLKGMTLAKWAVNKRNIRKLYFLQKYSMTHGKFNSPILLSMRKIHPINFSIVPHDFPKHEEKDIDVSFLATPYTGFREKFALHFKKVMEKNNFSYILSPGNLSPPEYIKAILRSKIVISVPGASYDIFRYWEIPYYGSCLMSIKLPLTITNNFENGTSAVFFKGIKDFEDRLVETIRNDRYDDIAKNGHDHFNRFHTDVKRAEQLISVLKEST